MGNYLLDLQYEENKKSGCLGSILFFTKDYLFFSFLFILDFFGSDPLLDIQTYFEAILAVTDSYCFGKHTPATKALITCKRPF